MMLWFGLLLLLVGLWFVAAGLLIDIEQSRRTHKPYMARPRWQDIARK